MFIYVVMFVKTGGNRPYVEKFPLSFVSSHCCHCFYIFTYRPTTTYALDINIENILLLVHVYWDVFFCLEIEYYWENSI